MSEYQNIDTVKELIKIEDVEEHLKKGWRILKMYTVCSSPNPESSGDQTLHYVLGHNRYLMGIYNSDAQPTNIFDQK